MPVEDATACSPVGIGVPLRHCGVRVRVCCSLTATGPDGAHGEPQGVYRAEVGDDRALCFGQQRGGRSGVNVFVFINGRCATTTNGDCSARGDTATG